MNRELPNTNIKFDGPRKNEMQEFLDFIYTIKLQNPSLILNSGIIYNQLAYRGLSRSEKNDLDYSGVDVGHFFNRWERNFKGKNVEAFCNKEDPRWFQFYNNMDFQNEYIKLYVPINLPHLYEGVNQLFDFIDREGIEHASKVSNIMRVDNVIILLRLEDIEDANKIIAFINNNKYLKTGLNKNNPFIPTVNGIGFMIEPGISYNERMSEYIVNYLNECFSKGKQKVSVEEFREYVKKYAYNNHIIEIFENAYTGKNPRFNREEEKKSELNLDQKIGLLMDCIKATYDKYGYQQVEYALSNALAYGNFDYFTNGKTKLHLREKLAECVSKEELSSIVKTTLDEMVSQKMIHKKSPFEIAEVYCKQILGDTLVFNLDEACNVTFENHGKEQLVGAINEYIKNNNASMFSKFFGVSGTNYRRVISSLGNENIMALITQSLKMRGYDIFGRSDEELINSYASMFEHTKYDSFEDRPKML